MTKESTKVKISHNWQKDFKSLAYLREYYSNIGKENEALLKFLVNAYRSIKPGKSVVDVGGGPTAYQLIASSVKAKEIYYTDFLAQNRQSLKKWKEKKHYPFSWHKYTKRILELEGEENSAIDILKREEITRDRIKKIYKIDIRNKKPLAINKKFDIASVQFVPESITDSFEQWQQNIKNIISLLKPRGYLIISSLEGAKEYRAGKKYFPATKIYLGDLIKLLVELGFNKKNIRKARVKAEHPEEQKYMGIAFLFAKR